jgi:rubrerythrin
MSTKDAQEKIVANMTRWQKIENASVASTGRVIEETENPIVRLVMEIIQRDSQMHHRVQEMIIDSLTAKAIAFSPDELGKVWHLIEKHIELEKQTVSLATESLAAIGKNKGMAVQAYLIEYLLKDEQKHDEILAKLAEVKKNMYPYG